MSGMLSGNGPGFLAGGAKTSQFVMAFKIDAFTDLAQFKDDMDALLKKLSGMKPAPAKSASTTPGSSSTKKPSGARANGIPYHSEVVDWFNETAAKLELNLHWP